MAESARQHVHKVSRAMIYSRSTRKPLAWIRSLEEAKIDDKVDLDPLKIGGETVDNAIKDRTYTLTLTGKDYSPILIQQLTNGVKTDLTASTSGQVRNLENVNGDSVYSAAGVASISVSGTVADLKPGLYTLEAKTATTLSMYVMGDLTLTDGTDKAFLDDTYKVLDDIAVTKDTATALSGFGLRLMGGSSTIAMTTGDTMIFEVRGANQSGYDIEVGGDDDFDDVGLIIYPARKNADFMFIEVYNVKLPGMPWDLKDSWSSWSISAEMVKDETKGAAYKVHRDIPE